MEGVVTRFVLSMYIYSGGADSILTYSKDDSARRCHGYTRLGGDTRYKTGYVVASGGGSVLGGGKHQ